MTKYIEITYRQRSYLNRECCLVVKSIGLKDRTMDIFLLTANSEAKFQKEGEWQGFVQSIKTFIHGENMQLTK